MSNEPATDLSGVLKAPKPAKTRYIRKHVSPGGIIEKIKLWPSRSGTLHGVKSIKTRGSFIELSTHCGQHIRIKNSRNSRVARWLRNKWYAEACPKCRVPQWKLDKYSNTKFQ